jgi:hypothetical protein
MVLIDLSQNGLLSNSYSSEWIDLWCFRNDFFIILFSNDFFYALSGFFTSRFMSRGLKMARL